MAVSREDFPAFGNLTQDNQIFQEIFQLKWTNVFTLCFCSHPTRPRSAMSLRSSLKCLAWPLLGLNAEYKEPPEPPLVTIRRSPSVFRSPWGEKWKFFTTSVGYSTPILSLFLYCIADYALYKMGAALQEMFDIPSILPSSVVTVIPTGAKISSSFPLSPFSARTLSIKIKFTHTKYTKQLWLTGLSTYYTTCLRISELRITADNILTRHLKGNVRLYL